LSAPFVGLDSRALLSYKRVVERGAFGLAAGNSRRYLGPYQLNHVAQGDCRELIDALPPDSIDVVVTSPPYWGQRISRGTGVEADPRVYLDTLTAIFDRIRAKLKPQGIVWINIGDSYNTPVNWRIEDRIYSTLGENGEGLAASNTAYTKPRAKRKVFVDPSEPWLTYGNLLALPYRLIIALCQTGYLFRGEVIWSKRNAMPEGRCRRPHRHHEPIYLLAKSEGHRFRTTPPVKTVWEFSNDKIDGPAHYSRFPEELPLRCIDAYGLAGPDVVVLDPFSGSGTAGIAALKLGCSYLGFEIDAEQVAASNRRLEASDGRQLQLFLA
jgi:DNA modification methylase